MPAYKDLQDMVRKAIEAEMREMEEMVETMSKQIREVMENESYLTPLYTEVWKEREVIYVVDVPRLRDETIYVKVNDQTLEFSCVDSNGLKYKLRIRIPSELKGCNIKVSRVRGRVTLKLVKEES
ncbi:MAG: hypothetical protein QXR57_05245 [Metallosphaera sp.]